MACAVRPIAVASSERPSEPAICDVIHSANLILAGCSLIHLPPWPALSDPSANLQAIAMASSKRPSEPAICDMIPSANPILAVNHTEINREAYQQIRYVQLVRTIGPHPGDLGSSPGGRIVRI